METAQLLEAAVEARPGGAGGALARAPLLRPLLALYRLAFGACRGR
jgi:hypothetical protein